MLRAEPWTKRAVLSLCGPPGGHVPCVNSIQFLVRNAEVRTFYFARGQDAFRKFYADGLCLGLMGQKVAGKLGLRPGTVTGFIASSHVYRRRPACHWPDAGARARGLGQRRPGREALMRVLFAVPRSHNPKQMYREYPLGVGYLGTILEQQGHAVAIFDQNVEGPEDSLLFDLVARFQPGVVGFSVITPNYPVARRQIRRLKEEHPGIRIIAGGIHANLFPEDLLADGADAVVLGEGEPVIAELVCRLQEGRPLDALPGLVFRGPAGQAVRTPGGPLVARLDQVPVVKRSLYNLPPLRPSLHDGLARLPLPLRLLLQLHRHRPQQRRGRAWP